MYAEVFVRIMYCKLYGALIYSSHWQGPSTGSLCRVLDVRGLKKSKIHATPHRLNYFVLTCSCVLFKCSLGPVAGSMPIG